MAVQHANRFLRLVEDAKKHIKEVTVQQVKDKLDHRESFHLVDVREESEWAQGHIPNAIHLGKGIVERDIERVIPDVNAEIVFYCGGGYRSALTAESLQKMGYLNVLSMDGGYRGWREAGLPVTKD